MKGPITVGVLSPMGGGFYFGRVLSGITREVAAVGGQVVFLQTFDAGTSAYNQLYAPDFTTPTAWDRVDGVIAVAASAGLDHLQRLKAAGIPVVLASNTAPGFDGPAAMPDNVGGARAAVEHLIGHGHTRIGFVGNLEQSDMRERHDAYRATLIANGLEADPALFFTSSDNIEEGGRIVAAELIARGMPVTAIFAATDRNAIGVILALAEAGYALPGDLAVVGFDDFENGWYITPALSTVNQRFDDVGALAARLLLTEIGGESLGGVRVDSPSMFVARDSCGCDGGQRKDRPRARVAIHELPSSAAFEAARAGLLTSDLIQSARSDDGQWARSLIDGLTMLAEAVDSALLNGVDVSVEEIRRAEAEIRRLQPPPELVRRVIAAITTYVVRLATAVDAKESEAQGILARCAARISTEFSQLQAGDENRRIAELEASMLESYDLSIQLLDRDNADTMGLGWLAGTHVHTGCLGLWDGPPEGRILRIVGVYDENRTLQGLLGEQMSVREFPPAALVQNADTSGQEVTFVIPVKGSGVDWGVLAVIGKIDTMTNNGRGTYNHWASLLTVALEQEQLDEDLRRSEERYSLATKATNDGLWDWDITTGIVYYSERCRHMLGLKAGGESLAGPEAWLNAVHPDDAAKLNEAIRTGIASSMPFEVEHRVRGAVGGYRWMMCRAQPVSRQGAGEAADRVVGSLADIHTRKELEDRLRLGALHDDITGLPNRRLFVDRLNWTIAQVHRAGEGNYAVVFLDLDGFKLVNDSLGHLVGDELLMEVGERLRRGLRSVDTAARFGGDEFAVLLYDVEPTSVLGTVQRIQEELSRPVRLHGTELSVTASVGIATSTSGYRSAEDVLRDADTAMYHAKSQSPGSTAIFDEEMHARAMNHLKVQTELRQALERNEFEVYYQPIVNLASRTARQFEALIRWRHPVRGIVLPAEFLPAMDETGSIVVLGHWILDEVCRQIAAWREDGVTDVHVSVNLSHREFWSGALLNFVDNCLARHSVSPESITLEITEGVIMVNPDAALRTMQELRSRGIKLDIDDFGTGHSSLHALCSFPLNALKIDRSFVRKLGIDKRTTELVQLIVAMGHTLGLDVVAEGVETEAQADMLQELGCSTGQGYWFARAVPATEAFGMLGHTLGHAFDLVAEQAAEQAARQMAKKTAGQTARRTARQAAKRTVGPTGG